MLHLWHHRTSATLVSLVPAHWKDGERTWRVQDQGRHEPEAHLLLLITRGPFSPWLAHFISQLCCVCPQVGNWVVFFLNLLGAGTKFCPTTLCQQHHHCCFLEGLTQNLATFPSNRMEGMQGRELSCSFPVIISGTNFAVMLVYLAVMFLLN